MWGLILAFIIIYPFLEVFDYSGLGSIVNPLFISIGTIHILLCGKKIKNNLLDIAVILFFIYIAALALNSADNDMATSPIYDYSVMFILFYLIRKSSPKQKKELLIILMIGGCLVSIYSLRSIFIVAKYLPLYLAEHNIDFSFTKEVLSRKRAFAPFVTANLLAQYLVMLIFISLSMLFVKRKNDRFGSVSVFCSIALLIFVICLFFTKSLGGLLSLFIPLIFFIMIVKKVNKKILAAIFLVVLLILGVTFLRFKETKDIYKPFFSLSQRAVYWKDTVGIIKKHPFKGIGLGNFSLKESRYAHNSYLQIWAEAGLVGFLLWLSIVFIFIKEGFSKLKILKSKGPYALILCCGLSFLIHNLIDFSFYVPQVAFLWWITLALAGSGWRDPGFDDHNNASQNSG